MVRVRLSAGVLYPAEGLRLPSASGGSGEYPLGLLHLFPDHHCRRTYLEGVGAGLPAADDSGYGACLSGEISVGILVDGDIHGV